jgi:hypothetical protein
VRSRMSFSGRPRAVPGRCCPRSFCFDGGDRGRDVEDLGGLGKADDVVLQCLAVDRLNTESHLRLLVDEDELAVLWGQNLKLVGHLKFSFLLG